MSGLLPRGVVTGLGAIQGIDPLVAARIAIDEAPDLPHVPELPQRGPWAEPIGRLSALLIDLPLEIEVGRWRTSAAVGRDLRRARALLAEDLDAVEEQWNGYEGPAKLQVCGPLTATGSIELRSGDALASDAAARTDLTASLVEGLVSHLAELRRRVPGALWCVQLDEPRAASVTRGQLARPSGWGTYPAIAHTEAVSLLHKVVDTVHGLEAAVIVHCCGAEPDWSLLGDSGAEALSVAVDQLDLGSSDVADRLSAWWGQGGDLWCDIDPSASGPLDENAPAQPGRLGILRSVVGSDAEAFAERLVLTPRCAIGGEGPVSLQAYADVRSVMERLPET
ncbi:MAG: methionine synthase [Actinomycetes bacterium]